MFPSPEKIQHFEEMKRICEPTKNDVIGLMDGVSFTSECSSEHVMQNAFIVGTIVIQWSIMC